MRIVITGAGLVGCHAARQFTDDGHQVLLLDARPQPDYLSAIAGPRAEVARRDVTGVDRLAGDLRAWRAEAVVHTAALMGQKAAAHPYLAYWVNAQGTAAVAEAARRAGVPRLVHVSSLSVYDWAAALASGKPSLPETSPTIARSVYGGSKLAAEAIVSGYARQGWFRAAILRLAGVFGPGRHAGGSRVGSALQRLVAAARDGREAVVAAGMGGHEYLYAADAGRAVALALGVLDQGAEPVRLYNIGTGRLHSAADIAAALRAALPGADVAVRPGPPGESLPLDVTLAHRELGSWVRHDLRHGIAALAGFMAGHDSMPGMAVAADSTVSATGGGL